MKADLRGYAPEQVERRAETTAREEGWVLTSELLKEPLPPVVTAFCAFHHDAWAAFTEQLDPAGLRFFNSEDGEFSSAPSWEALLGTTGIPIGTGLLSCPKGATPEQCRIVRQTRNLMHALSDEDEFALKGQVFSLDSEDRLMVTHKSDLTRSFFLDRDGANARYAKIYDMLEAHGWRLDSVYITWSRIIPIN